MKSLLAQVRNESSSTDQQGHSLENIKTKAKHSIKITMPTKNRLQKPAIAFSGSKLSLAIATTGLEALQPLVLVLAYQLGATRLVNGHNPINFCNGLLFGNAFSLVALLLVKTLTTGRRQQGRKNTSAWTWPLAIQSLIPITCNVLLESSLIIAFSRISAVVVSLIVACTAVALMLWQSIELHRAPRGISTTGALLVAFSAWIGISPGQEQTAGEQLHAIGANLIPNTTNGNHFLLVLILILSVLYFRLSERFTQELGALSYSIYQTAIQTLIFLIWATTTFGLTHLYDLRSPLLWQVMLIYGGVISTAYTLVESAALARAGGTLVALCEGFLPFASGLFAWLLLSERITVNIVMSSLVAAAGIGLIEANKLGSRDQDTIKS